MTRPIPEVEQLCRCSKCGAETTAIPDATGKWDCSECGWRHYPSKGDHGTHVPVRDEKGLGKRQKEVLELLREKPMRVGSVMKLGYRKHVFHRLLWRGLIEKDIEDGAKWKGVWKGKWRAT